MIGLDEAGGERGWGVSYQTQNNRAINRFSLFDKQPSRVKLIN